MVDLVSLITKIDKIVWTVIVFVLYTTTGADDSNATASLSFPSLNVNASSTVTSRVTHSSDVSATSLNQTTRSTLSTSGTVASPTTPWYSSIEWIIGFSVGGSVLIVLIIAFARLCCRCCCGRKRKRSLPVFPPDHDSALNEGGSQRGAVSGSGEGDYFHYGSRVQLAGDDPQSVQYHAGNRRTNDRFRF